MSDIFKDMQANVGCDYISNLPSYKRKVWHEMKRLPLTNYDIKQLEDFSKYVFGMSYQSLKDVMKQQKGRDLQCRKQRVLVETRGTTGEETISYWFDLPIDVAEFEEKLGFGAESVDYRIIEKGVRLLLQVSMLYELNCVYQLWTN